MVLFSQFGHRKSMERWTNKQTNGQRGGRIILGKQTDKRTDRWTNKKGANKQTNGQIGGRTISGKQTDKRTEPQTFANFNIDF